MPDVHWGQGATVGSVIATKGAVIPAAHGEGLTPLMARLKPMVDVVPPIAQAAERAPRHAGTLGTGNHFIEAAKREMKRWFIDLPDQDLADLPEGSDLFADDLEAVGWAQAFAHLNRELMMAASLVALTESVAKPFHCDCQAINCHHNDVTRERRFNADVLLTRKGAVAAFAGMLGIIPGSMGSQSYSVRGKGKREAFGSCSHGAGRPCRRHRRGGMPQS